MSSVSIHNGDCLDVLRTLPDSSVNCCVTSPPYWGLRDYGVDGQIGLERTPSEYVAKMVAVFAEVRRVLRDDGTCWVNLEDSYAASSNTGGTNSIQGTAKRMGAMTSKRHRIPDGLKAKDLCGIPWSVAKALQAPRYTGSITNEMDRVWMAAIIDAEGSICGFTHKRKDNGSIRNGIHVTVTNSNPAILDKCFRIWPTTREDHNMHGDGHLGSLPTWRWIPHGMEVKSQLLQEIYPYLVGKKKQALLAWNFLQISKMARGRNKGEEGESNRDRYSWIVHALSKLNHLEPVDIPGWCVEPPDMFEPGWYLRSDIIWSKCNPMPESVTDRPTKAHEYLFLLSKSEMYWYDAGAIKERASIGWNGSDFLDARDLEIHPNTGKKPRQFGASKPNGTFRQDVGNTFVDNGTRNKRSVWTVPTAPYSEAHFATFPPDLIKPCILAGCPVGGTVLDPFGGSGTTGMVALELGRNAVLIELNPEYVKLAERRTHVTPGFF